MNGVDPARPLRVCLVVPYDVADEGGVKRHAFNVAESLRKMGDDVSVVGPMSRGVHGVGFKGFGGVVNIPANGAANHMAILTPPWAVRQYFRDASFDVVHLHEPLVPLLSYYALWFSSGAAHVCTFHMYAETEVPGIRRVRRLLARRMYPRFERGIAVSQPAADYAGREWTRELAIIPNGVPTQVFRPMEPRGPLASRGTPFRLLFVGNWRDPRKGLPYLLEAHRKLRAAGSLVDLHVLGAGTPGVEQAHPGVTFHGSVTAEAELASHYQRCDLFVSPATGQEAFGIVLLEATACARPLVCSDIAGYRQAADPKGAIFVAPEDVDGLVRAITTLAKDPEARQRMGEFNRSRAAAFEWDLLVGQIRAQYLAALRERRQGPLTDPGLAGTVT